jgi:predicted Zn-dependent protease
MPLARALSLVVALVVCAWFALGIRQAHDTSQAAAILSHGAELSYAQAAHADSLLHSARVLNPDLQVDVLRAQAALIENDRARAARILEDVVRREPTNLDGWVFLTRASRNVPELERAAARIAELDPKALKQRH